MMVDLQPNPEPPPEPSKVYESDFKIPNFKSGQVAQVGLWYSQKPRMCSLFASYASKRHILIVKNMTLCLPFFHGRLPWRRRFPISSEFKN